ncbi:MAG: NADH-quinone oxidoreductase subunit H [Elusimicrobia bacterium]|nr:NADH-quinone oxidoreductase subunit H [Elusimicrobiota bacterium]
MLASFIDRKLTARIQWRKGPPLLQPLYDLVKLFGKETIIPAQASKALFLLLPLISVSAVALFAILNGVIVKSSVAPFSGDLFVAIYLMIVPAVCLILAAGISGNPLAIVGASREMKLVLSYELPFILALLVAVIKSHGEIVITGIMSYQAYTAPFLFSLSGALAFLAAIICLVAKLGLVPFDAAEAEQEIIAGVLVEYSGFSLAMFKLSKMMMLFVYPMFLIKLFWHNACGSVIGDVMVFALKYFVVLLIIVLIRNTNPRLRIDQSVKFFWTYVFGISLLAVIFAFIGL